MAKLFSAAEDGTSRINPSGKIMKLRVVFERRKRIPAIFETVDSVHDACMFVKDFLKRNGYATWNVEHAFIITNGVHAAEIIFPSCSTKEPEIAAVMLDPITRKRTDAVIYTSTAFNKLIVGRDESRRLDEQVKSEINTQIESKLSVLCDLMRGLCSTSSTLEFTSEEFSKQLRIEAKSGTNSIAVCRVDCLENDDQPKISIRYESPSVYLRSLDSFVSQRRALDEFIGACRQLESTVQSLSKFESGSTIRARLSGKEYSTDIDLAV